MQEAIPPQQTQTRHWMVIQDDTTFCVRSLHWQDTSQHAAYQALRYQIFYEQLHWAVSVTADGREIDRYDQCADLPLWTHTVSIEHEAEEHLLAGVRTCGLRDWADAMVMGELQAAGLFSAAELRALQVSYSPDQLLEVTRLCVRRSGERGSRRHWERASLHRAQQLAYASVYQVAAYTGRSLVLAVVSSGYLRLLVQLGFVVQLCSAHGLQEPAGYALTIIDLTASIHTMCSQGKGEQAARLLCLCQARQGMEHITAINQIMENDLFQKVQGEEL